MDNATFDEYLKNRYENQMEFYGKAAIKNQKKYKWFQWVLVILSALTPVIAALNGKIKFSSGADVHTVHLGIVVVIVSSIVAILTTGLKTFNYQELWITYRSTYEKLKPEIHYYHFNVGPYKAAETDKEALFVSRVEAILGAEHMQWPPSKNIQNAQEKKGESAAGEN